MISNHIHHALEQVRELQSRLLGDRLFLGYSGMARILSGVVACATTFYMGSSHVPQNPWVHCAWWAGILLVGLLLNYGALVYWFFFDPQAKRDWTRLEPVGDALPPLILGALLTQHLTLHEHFGSLFGIWLALYGLVHFSSRHTLPKGIASVGVLYLAVGAYYLLDTDISFYKPQGVGLTFLLGEVIGGIILLRARSERSSHE